MTVWNDQRTSRLVALCKEGLSSSQIAAAIGGVSRNAVIGKMNRLALTNGHQPRPKTVAISEPKMPGQGRIRESLFKPYVPPQPLPPEKTLKTKYTSIAELRLDQCRWPYGDRDYTF